MARSVREECAVVVERNECARNRWRWGRMIGERHRVEDDSPGFLFSFVVGDEPYANRCPEQQTRGGRESQPGSHPAPLLNGTANVLANPVKRFVRQNWPRSPEFLGELGKLALLRLGERAIVVSGVVHGKAPWASDRRRRAAKIGRASV